MYEHKGPNFPHLIWSLNLLIKYSRTIRYSVTTIRVYEYYSEITNGPNMNSTICSQLFEYQIIQIIRSNPDLKSK